MKKLIFLFISTYVLLVACTDRYEALAELDHPPVLRIIKDGQHLIELRDSTKLFPNSYYNLNLLLKDTNENLQSFRFVATPSYSKVFIGQMEYKNSLPVEIENTYLNILPSRTGIEKFVFTLSDRFGKTDVANFTLVTFANIPPKVEFTVIEKRQNDPLEYELNGSNSVDGDQKFGGRIVNYKWLINNTQTLNSLAPTIRYIFPQQGLFKIDLEVTDNEGATTRLTKYVTIN